MRYNISFSKRLSPAPTIPSPFGVRSAGHYRLWKNFHQPVRNELNFLELFWIVSGSFVIRMQEGTATIHAQEAAFLFPGDSHEYWTTEDTDLYWLTIDGEHCARLGSDYQLPRKPFLTGRCPKEKFSQLLMEVSEEDAVSQYAALSSALTIIHMVLGGSCLHAEPPNLITRFKRLAKQHFRDRDCGVDTLAGKLHVHRGTLHRLLVRSDGTTPSEYIADLRLREALNLLNSGCSIQETARQCGYANPNYMSKVIRSKTGLSPKQCSQVEPELLQICTNQPPER